MTSTAYRLQTERGASQRRRGSAEIRLRSGRVAALLLVVCSFAAGHAWAGDRGADGRFDKRTSSHFVLYQDVDIDQSAGFHGSRRFEQQVLETLEEAYSALDQQLGLRPRRPIKVVVYDPIVFDQRFAGLFRFPAAGFYGGTIHIRGDTTLHVPLVRTLHHELVHAAFDAVAPSLALPAWVNEGLAEWFEARAVGKRLLTPSELAALSRASESGRLYSLAQLSGPSFGRLGPREAGLAYLQSYAFFEFLARHHGERSLRELCDRYLRVGDLARAFRRTYRTDLPALEERFAAELRGA